jgi:hypothetical protein
MKNDFEHYTDEPNKIHHRPFIKPTELRIGNLVEYNGTADAIILIDHKGCELVRFGYLSLQDEVQPIPLTEEWLVKFGIEKDEDLESEYPFDFGSFLPFTRYSPIKKEMTNADWMNSKPLEYVHQLQNLYLALTGEELILTENGKA